MAFLDYTGLGYFFNKLKGLFASKANTVLDTTLSHGRTPNTTVGTNSFAFGLDVTASDDCTHAEGYSSIASNWIAHAEGASTTSSGLASHSEGAGTEASGDHSHSEGTGTIANHLSQHAGGSYNVEDPSASSSFSRGNYLELIGNGLSILSRSNARALDWDGNEYLSGTVKVGCDTDSSGGREVVDTIEFTDEDTVATMFAKLDALPYNKPSCIYVSSGAINILTNGDYTAYDSYGSVLKQQATENDTDIDVYKYTLTYSNYATLVLYQKAPSASSIGTVTQHRMVDDYADQSINGAKRFTDTVTMMNHQTVPKIYFRGSNMENSSAVIYANACATSNNDYGNTYFSFYEYGPSANASTRSSYYERYSLPAADSARSSHGNYNILTSKENVTVAQGGTGAGNASDARDNLGLGSMAVKNLTTTSVAANKSLAIESVPNGALIVAYATNTQKYFGYKRGNANMCPLVSEGSSVTVAASGGTVTVTNGTSSTCYIGIIGG